MNMNQLFIQGVQIQWDKIEENSYLRKISALQFEEELKFSQAITFFVGENGTGKSTLLEAIAVAYGFNPEACMELLPAGREFLQRGNKRRGVF